MVFMMNKTAAALLALVVVSFAGTASADPVVVKSVGVAKDVAGVKKPAKQMVCHIETLQQGSGTVKVCEWK